MPDEGLLCDVLWSDPEPDQKGWGENDRGVSFTFGTDVVTKFLNRHDLDLVRGRLNAGAQRHPTRLTRCAELFACHSWWFSHGRSSARCIFWLNCSPRVLAKILLWCRCAALTRL